ncbi:MAG: hypothetical protein IJS29_05290 [Selenomonadaceae bacterium]|nr:hypothetical protein [Selenomonadaceae bacterium]
MIVLKHKESGLMKECVTGFSWTTFFFGLFVPLIRGDLKWAAILFALSLLVGALTFGIGAIVVNIVFSFVYNKIYIRNLMTRGFIPADEASQNWCIANGLLAVPR